jgi:hypothetical protein
MGISSPHDREKYDETSIRLSANQFLADDAVAGDVIGGGRNSKVYRLIDSNGSQYALKVYFHHEADTRDRLWTEFKSLQFLWNNGFRDIPRPFIVEHTRGYGVYEFIEGRRIVNLTETELFVAIEFLVRLKKLREQARQTSIGAASEACFSGNTLLGNIRQRLDLLIDQADIYSDLKGFLKGEFVPAFNVIDEWCRTRMPFDVELDRLEISLSPSDFGFHNALQRMSNGQFVFLDFEYFGWDDPAKTISDFLLHPAMNLTDELKRLFATQVLRHFEECPNLEERVETLYPLYGLKWCLILLNEFLPDRLQRRQFVREFDLNSVQKEQLAKARFMLHRIIREYEKFPYFD